jgi:hypothetical protein
MFHVLIATTYQAVSFLHDNHVAHLVNFEGVGILLLADVYYGDRRIFRVKIS